MVPRGHLRLAAIGVGAGWLSGTAAFLLIHPKVLPFNNYSFYPVAFILAAGAFAHLFAASLTESVYALALSFLFGSAVLFGAQVAPLYVLPYEESTRNALMLPFLAPAVTTAITKYLYYLIGGYMVAVGATLLRSYWRHPG